MACLIRVPTEVVKSRAQTSTYGPNASGSLAAARNILASDGFKGFYRGFGSTIIREVRRLLSSSQVGSLTNALILADPVHFNTVPSLRIS